MDSVPVLFHEAVAIHFDWDDLFEFSKLPAIGAVVTENEGKYAVRIFKVKSGKLVDDHFWYNRENAEWVHVEDGRLCRSVEIDIRAGNNAYKADPQVLQRIHAYSRGKQVRLRLHTSNLSEEVVALLDQISVSDLILKNNAFFDAQSVARIMPTLQKIVLKKTLYAFEIERGEQSDGMCANLLLVLLLDLWKQEQFQRADFPVLNCTTLMALLVAWHENSMLMTGKYLQFKKLVGNVDLERLGFRIATEDELDHLEKYFLCDSNCFTAESAQHVRFAQNDEGGRTFWLTMDDPNVIAFL